MQVTSWAVFLIKDLAIKSRQDQELLFLTLQHLKQIEFPLEGNSHCYRVQVINLIHPQVENAVV